MLLRCLWESHQIEVYDASRCSTLTEVREEAVWLTGGVGGSIYSNPWKSQIGHQILLLRMEMCRLYGCLGE